MTDAEPTPEELEAEYEAETDPLSEWRMAQPLTKRDRARWVLRVGALDQQGLTQRAIAAKTGISQPTVSRFRKMFYDTVVLPQAEESRKHEIALVDNVIEAWIDRALAGDEKAATVLDKYLTRRSKLSGSEAAIKVEATVTEVTQADLEMAELLNEAKAAQENKMKELRG